jgi:hypothetical protein
MNWNVNCCLYRLERTVWQVRVSGEVAMVEAGEGRGEIRSDFRPKVRAETGR